ncbi:MAG: sulfotransferase domain-containing protein [Pseudomonadota bacterium]
MLTHDSLEAAKQLRANHHKFVSPTSLEHARSFTLRSNDIVIATYPKSGTTWMQQLVHGIRSSGSMEFEEITDVVPWLEVAYDVGQDLNAEQCSPVRAFKTHFSWHEVPKDARYIVVVRNPDDVLLSYYHFLNGYLFKENSIMLEDFAQEFFIPGGRSGRYWPHLYSWWSQIDNPQVLLVSYESMLTDLPVIAERVADFMGLKVSREILDVAISQASYAFMKANEQQFDDHVVITALNKLHGRTTKDFSSKIREGHSNSTKMLPLNIKQVLAQCWQEELASPLGFSDYDSLKQAIDFRIGLLPGNKA